MAKCKMLSFTMVLIIQSVFVPYNYKFLLITWWNLRKVVHFILNHIHLQVLVINYEFFMKIKVIMTISLQNNTVKTMKWTLQFDPFGGSPVHKDLLLIRVIHFEGHLYKDLLLIKVIHSEGHLYIKTYCLSRSYLQVP